MPRPTVSIITALADRSGHRLSEIHAVLAASDARWEWLIQLDGAGDSGFLDGAGDSGFLDGAGDSEFLDGAGDSEFLDGAGDSEFLGRAREGRLPNAVVSDARVSVESNGRRLGIAVTRNRALARATAELLLNADSDDVPTAAALGALVPAFDDPTVGLAFGDWIEHWPDREPWRPARRFSPGRQNPGMLSAIWSAERWVPLHLAGAMWRTDAVLAAGGWSATVGGSDIGLMLGVDAAWASVYVPVTTFTYHHHAHQVTASRDWQSQFDRDMRFLERRRRALDRIRDPRSAGVNASPARGLPRIGRVIDGPG